MTYTLYDYVNETIHRNSAVSTQNLYIHVIFEPATCRKFGFLENVSLLLEIVGHEQINMDIVATTTSLQRIKVLKWIIPSYSEEPKLLYSAKIKKCKFFVSNDLVKPCNTLSMLQISSSSSSEQVNRHVLLMALFYVFVLYGLLHFIYYWSRFVQVETFEAR